MRKVMLLAAMLAMVLAAAAPAFAQAVAIDEGDDVEYNAVCQNILGSVGDITQNQNGDADAFATDDSAAAAEVAQEQNVTIEQVNECLNTADLDGDGFVTVVELDEFGVFVAGGGSASASASTSASTSASAGGGGGGGGGTGGGGGGGGSASASASSSASASASSSATAAAGGTLPDTGGASLFALGAGALLVGGGLLARRIVR